MSSAKRLLVFGYFGFSNAGDEAILSSLVQDLRRREPGLGVTVTSGDPARTAADHDVDAVAWNDVAGLVAAARSCDLLVLGGGGLLHDYWPFDLSAVLSRYYNGMVFFASAAVLAHLVQKPLVVCGIGVGPLTSQEAQELTRIIFEVADAATLRDEGSLSLLLELGIDPASVHGTADPGFRLPLAPFDAVRDRALEAGVVLGASNYVGVVLREWNLGAEGDAWETVVAEALDDFVDSHPVRVVFIPFQVLEEHLSDDRVVCNRVRDRMRNRDKSVALGGGFGPGELAALLGSLQMVVSVRLHGAILAARSGVPVVALGYDPKVWHQMASLGCKDFVLDFDGLSVELLRARMEAAWEQRDELAPRLVARGEELAATALGNVDVVIDALHAEWQPKAASPRLSRLLRRTTLARIEEAGHLPPITGAKRSEPVPHRGSPGPGTSPSEDDRLRIERAVLEAERDFYRVQAQTAAARRAELEARIQLLADDRAELSRSLGALAGTRWVRLGDRYWRLRRGWRSASGWFGRRFLAALPPAARRAVRGLRRGFGLMSPYAYVYELFRRARTRQVRRDLRGIDCATEAGLVSIVLPVFNGESMVGEALDSILAQTYPHFEVIVINDGSTDGTAQVLDAYARRDHRIRVIHQENRKIPRTLSRGFRAARGRYRTWTSDDNRLKPRFLERMVDCLERHPDWDMVYANMDLIGEMGEPLRGSSWFYDYQVPPGSEHVHLPENVAELNTWANNFIGAAFLYRDRVSWLLGDYSRIRFTTEDYDYWMRLNALLTLRHADFDEPLYEYRFHSRSLTARDEELGITAGREKLMVFDDFRRDFSLTPILWLLAAPEGRAGGKRVEALVDELGRCIAAAGHRRCGPDALDPQELPRLFLPCIYVRPAETWRGDEEPPENLPAAALRVAVAVGDADLPDGLPAAWDAAIVLGAAPPRRPVEAARGWIGVSDAATLFAALDVRSRCAQLQALEEEIDSLAAERDASAPLISVIICTYQRTLALPQAVESVARQTMSPERYELLIVDNNPQDEALVEQIEGLRQRYFADRTHLFRAVVCPFVGLSHARNAGISEARGEILVFLDDDAIADPTLLVHVARTFRDHPQAGVVGGKILLKVPEPRPPVVHEGWQRYWSHFEPGYAHPTVVRHWWEFPWGANWSARRSAMLEIGGFRTRYGRRGKDFSGGEELIAASLVQRIGRSIVVDPAARVEHDVEESRYTLFHVRKTVIAGTQVSYQAQRDLYVPMESSVWHTLRLLLNPAFDRSVEVKQPLHRWRHWAYRREAWLRLLFTQLRDLVKRMGREEWRR